MVVSILLGVASFLLCVPSCMIAVGDRQQGLFNRIEIERHERFQAAFSNRRSRLPGVDWLLRHQEVASKFSRYVGLDRQKVEGILGRLRWEVTFEEMLLAKLVGGFLLLASLVYVAFSL